MNAETCEKGREQYEYFYSGITKRDLVQYDYRTDGGRLFSCVAHTVKEARQRRDRWLKEEES